jgi:hypothetical protein
MPELPGDQNLIYSYIYARRIIANGIPVGVRFSAPVQNGPGAHQASYEMDTGSFPGSSGRDVELTTNPHLALMLKKE